MKDLKSEQKKQLKKIRDSVYDALSETHIYEKDKFVQKIIKETYLETKKELLNDLFDEWIKCNHKERENALSYFFMYFEKKFRADFQNKNYSLSKESVSK